MKEIKLTQGKVAMVDDEDYEYLSQWRWYVRKQGDLFYAQRCHYLGGGRKNCKSEIIQIHRLLMDAKKGEIIDHKDGNGLNCQRSNIRKATYSQNGANRKAYGVSMYLGVSRHKKSVGWYATIRINKKKKHIGVFKSEENAAIAYNIFAEKYHDKFARFNKA